MRPNFVYGITSIGDLRIVANPNKPKEHIVEAEGAPAVATPRFWQSFASKYGISQGIFNYYSHNEVLKRIAKRVPNDKVRYCIERYGPSRRRILAIGNPDEPLVEHDELADLLQQRKGRLSYVNGVLSSTHRPRSGDCACRIGGDVFRRRLEFEAPIDGFGQPRIYTSLLREVCSNGMIGYGRAFRSDVTLGTDATHSIRRAIDSYDDDKGYATLGRRFESAQTSWASLRECLLLTRKLKSSKLKREAKPITLARTLNRITGNLNEIYGLANLNALSVKRQRVLPSRCRVYDLMNFASEVATHHAAPSGARILQAFIGTLVSDEYDMEGTAEEVTDFNDFFVQAPETNVAPSVDAVSL